MKMHAKRKAVLDMVFVGEKGFGTGVTAAFYSTIAHALQVVTENQKNKFWVPGEDDEAETLHRVDVVGEIANDAPVVRHSNVGFTFIDPFSQKPLVVGGEDVAVTPNNLTLYVQSVLDLWLDSGIRAQVLAFREGISEALKPQFEVVRRIVENSDVDHALPFARTCTNTLHLPAYSSKAVLAKQMTFAIANSRGVIDRD
ncbi:unnamed protein product [Peronospora destructor]|nr:unnamed protein product [Peronospora destructor]